MFSLVSKKRAKPAAAVASLFAAATSEEPSEAPSAEPADQTAPPPAAAVSAPPAPTPAARVTRVGAYRFGRRYTREKREPIAPSGVARLRSIAAFEREGDLGAGAMARVFRARDRESGASVAIKAFKAFSDAARPDEAEAEEEIGGVPLEVLRECALLRSLRHPNIVRAHEVLTAQEGGASASLYLSMEAVDYDLGLLIEHMAQPFTEGQVKGLAHQLLSALAALEALGIAHRDLKQTNLLIDKDGVVRLADFGLARRLPASAEPLTPDVTSLWYRAPEVLLGAHCCDRRGGAAAHGGYGLAADAWAFGILTCEWLRKGEPLLPGQSELDQLQRIFRLLGAPTAASWPALFDGASLPRARLVALAASAELTCETLDVATGASVQMPRSQLRRLLPLRGFDPAVPSTAQLTTTGLSTAGYECVAGCLELDPRRRPLASDALRHRWFGEAPLAESLTRFDMRALSRARTAAVSSGAHAISIALQNAQRAAVAAVPAALHGCGGAAAFGAGMPRR